MKFDIEVILPKYESLYKKCIKDYLTKWIQNSSLTGLEVRTPSAS
jgi:hypothetical protein